MLASRVVPAAALSDPTVALLSSLTSDIDGTAGPAGGAAPAGWRPVPRHRGGHARPEGTWPHAAAAAAVAAAIATLTAVAAATLMIVGMFARMGAARGHAHRPRC
jgi:hypothetical protein